MTFSYPNPQETPDDAAFKAAVAQGLASSDAGHTVPYQDVRLWLLSWGQ
jgi:predicted transcriptional regulator